MSSEEVNRILLWVGGCFLLGLVMTVLVAITGCVTVNRNPILVPHPQEKSYQIMPYYPPHDNADLPSL